MIFGSKVFVSIITVSVWLTILQVEAQHYPYTDPSNTGGWIPYEPMTDEFDGVALDPEKWQAVSWDGRKPIFHEYNNVTLSNGIAILKTSWKDGPVGSVNESDYSISAGYFESTTDRRYGYFEISCRALDFPIMTTWWLTGGGRAYTREIDMLECPSGVAGYKNYYSCNFHIWKTPTPTGVDDNGGGSIPDPEHYWLPWNMVDDFHVYGFEWDKDFCRIYIDGQLYRERATGSFKVGQRLMVGNEYNGWLNTVSEINTNLHKIGATYDVEYVRAWIKPETDERWYVDSAYGNDANSGSSWSDAKQTIQGAINEAYDGDEIWVAQGYYQEYVTFHGMNNIEVYGGFVPGDSSLNDRNPAENPTIIQAPPDGYSPVCIKGNTGFRLDGFTVSGATKAYHDHGIDINGPCTNVVIANCRTIGNKPTAGGSAGMVVDGVDGADFGLAMTQVRYENCEIAENEALGSYSDSAAFSIRDGAQVEFINTKIINNKSAAKGGVLNMYRNSWDAPKSSNTYVYMEGCEIAGNSNAVGSAAIRFNYGTIDFENCTIANNISDGVDLVIGEGASCSMVNTVVVNNNGDGFYSSSADFTLENNLFFGNANGQVYYSGYKNTEGAINGLSQASGNVVGDPLFMNVSIGDFRLQSGSPAIGAAQPPAVDIGAHAYVAGSPIQWPVASMTIPGRIEAENFDYGGEGVAYHDTDAVNNGNYYRFEGPDVELKTTQTSPSIGWNDVGEWMEYTVDVTPGTYTLRALAGTIASGRSLRVKLDDVILADLSTPNTGGWSVFDTVETTVTVVGDSNSVLRLEVLGGGQNINWVEFFEEPFIASQDIGSPSLSGSMRLERGRYYVKGDGPATYNGTSDNFHYINKVLTGDGYVIARVAELASGALGSNSGIMFRESLVMDSKFVEAVQLQNKQAIMIWRSATGAMPQYIGNGLVGDTNTTKWVALARRGDEFRAYYSIDGEGWVLAAEPQTISMNSSLYIGLSVNGASAGDYNQTIFTDVSSGSDPLAMVPVETDSDGDGVPDNWEIDYGTFALTNDAALDPDGDGMDSGTEYVAGTDPQDSGSLFAPWLGPKNGSSLTLEWDPKAGRVYDVYWREFLDGDPFAIIETGLTTPQNSYTDTDAVRTNLTSGFYQMRVRLP